MAVICSAGVLSGLPFWHAASRLQRPALRRPAVLYSLAGIAFLVISGLIPQDAAGNPVGTGAAAAENLLVAFALVVIIAACVQLRPIRREVFGGPVPRAPLSGDPAVARILEGRAQRHAARDLIAKDPAAARELGIGYPELHRGYDDGGLLYIETATPELLTQICHIEPGRAAQIVASRELHQGFVSVADVVVDVALLPEEEYELGERGIF